MGVIELLGLSMVGSLITEKVVDSVPMLRNLLRGETMAQASEMTMQAFMSSIKNQMKEALIEAEAEKQQAG